MAGLRKESDLAVGNAIGSCICNIGLILGASAAFKHIDVHPPALRRPIIVMFLCGLLLFAMTLDLGLQRWQGLLLMLLGLVYFVWDLCQHLLHPKTAEIKEATTIEQDLAGRFAWLRTRWETVLQFFGGAAVVIIGSRLLVEAAVATAAMLGIRPIVIGLTVVAIGTSLPELITAFTSSRQNVSDLSIGNILGANIANLTIVLGAAALLQDVRLDRTTQALNFPALLASMILFLYVALTENRVTRRQRVLLLTTYGVYLGAIIIVAVSSAR